MNLNSQQITDILIAIQAIITLLIAIRAFTFYFRTRSDALLALGLSFGIIGIGGITGVIDDPFLHGNPTFNTLWFRHIGQTVGYLFIFLASLRGSEYYSRFLKPWHIVATILLLVLMFLTPIIPEKVPNSTVGILSAIRCITCMLIFFSYASAFFYKSTKFSLLMALSFLLTGLGLYVYTIRYFVPHPLYYDFIADGTRVIGLIVLYVAFYV